MRAEWFTVAGLAGDDREDYIQVNSATIRVDDDRRRLDVRVSRAVERTNSEGIRFRSFQGVAEVDWAVSSARYVSATFYALPHFAGTPIAQLDYPPDRVRPMAFRQISGEFAARVIRAACAAQPAGSRTVDAGEGQSDPAGEGTH